MRENLDPAGQHSERDLIAALKAVNLWEVLAGVSLSQAKAADVPRPGAAAGAAAVSARPNTAIAVSPALARSVANSTPINIQGVSSAIVGCVAVQTVARLVVLWPLWLCLPALHRRRQSGQPD